MIEEPYFNSNLCFSNMDLHSNVTTYFIQWRDKFVNHEEEVDEEFVNKWNGYAFLCRLSNEEMLILK